MKKPSLFLDFSLLQTNNHFRNIFIARTMSVLALGMLTVAVPVQIHNLTGSSLQVGIIMALDGIGMFVGMLMGGVLADRLDRRKLILLGRSLAAVGFVALAINSLSASPSLIVLYVFSVWGGFFGAIGMSALMAVLPGLVGRENIAAAGALSMLTLRLGSIVAPALGGLIIAMGDVVWNYSTAAAATFCTLIPLTRLPALAPKPGKAPNPLKALAAGFVFIYNHQVLGSVAIVAVLDSLSKGFRVLFPALVTVVYGGGAFEIGLMYSAVPLGAMLGAVTSGWVATIRQPGVAMLTTCCGAFAAIVMLGLVNYYWLAMGILVFYGYLTAICGLLQFTFVQGHTPDNLLGRTNSLWHAQNVAGDSLGAVMVGILAKIFAPAVAIFAFGAVVFTLGAVVSIRSVNSLGKVSVADSNLSNNTDNEKKSAVEGYDKSQPDVKAESVA